MTELVEAIVIGAGVVGLAIARQLAMRGHDVIILEEKNHFGTGISARNSEVIHAGLYYPSNSLKARFCVQGKHALYAFAERHSIAHQKCGKLVVATTELQKDALTGILKQAHANGVQDLRLLSGKEARALEPALHCEAALYSPSTGILDSHGLMLALLGEAESHGAMLAVEAPFLTGRLTSSGFSLSVGGPHPMDLDCKILINAGGLQAQAIAKRLEGFPAPLIPPAYLAKGNYFALEGQAPFAHLIYPVPEKAGLGVHLTLDLQGRAKFGPDVEWIDTEDYTVTSARADGFYAAIRSYWPDLQDGQLHADYAGIRPKIQAPGETAQDFRIQGPQQHMIPGLVNLFGIESPGLTSCLAIADYVVGALSP